jgi:type IV secretory pathway VirB6-like protein
MSDAEIILRICIAIAAVMAPVFVIFYLVNPRR